MTPHLFTYGTLMIDAVMQKVVKGKTFSSAPAVLQDYARVALRGEVFPGVIPAAGQTVEGRLYFDLDEDALHRLDTFESDMYTREIVTARCPQGEVKACVYVMAPASRALCLEQPWDLEKFTRDHLTDYLNAIH